MTRWFVKNTTGGVDRPPHVAQYEHHMGDVAPNRTFRGWLNRTLADKKVARRELARRLAAGHPEGVTPQTIETYRRAIYRYLDERDPMIPNAQTRNAFADALGVPRDEVPAEDDEEPDLEAALQALARDHAEWGRRLSRVLKATART